jgi:hypothetical protein
MIWTSFVPPNTPASFQVCSLEAHFSANSVRELHQAAANLFRIERTSQPAARQV